MNNWPFYLFKDNEVVAATLTKEAHEAARRLLGEDRSNPKAAELRRQADEAWERGDKALSTQLHDEARKLEKKGQ